MLALPDVEPLDAIEDHDVDPRGEGLVFEGADFLESVPLGDGLQGGFEIILVYRGEISHVFIVIGLGAIAQFSYFVFGNSVFRGPHEFIGGVV